MATFAGFGWIVFVDWLFGEDIGDMPVGQIVGGMAVIWLIGEVLPLLWRWSKQRRAVARP